MSAISGASSVLQVLSQAISGGLPFSPAALSKASDSELASLGTAQIALQQSQDLFAPSSTDATNSTASADSLDPSSVTQNYLDLQSGYDAYAQANPAAVAPQTGSLVNLLA